MSDGEIKSTWAAVQDHTRHFSDFTFVYPVISRRSKGLSIGVNLNPDKVCNFDCIYCEVDRRIPGAVTEVDLCQMKDELTAMVRFAKDGGLAKEPKFNEVPWLTREVKDIAFSGDGEPTMIQNFAECVETVVEVQQLEGLDDIFAEYKTKLEKAKAEAQARMANSEERFKVFQATVRRRVSYVLLVCLKINLWTFLDGILTE